MSEQTKSPWRGMVEQELIDYYGPKALVGLEVPADLVERGYDSLTARVDNMDVMELKKTKNYRGVVQACYEEQRYLTVYDCALEMKFQAMKRDKDVDRVQKAMDDEVGPLHPVQLGEIKPALYDPVNDPEGAKQADEYIARQNPRHLEHSDLLFGRGKRRQHAAQAAFGHKLPTCWEATHVPSGTTALVFAPDRLRAERAAKMALAVATKSRPMPSDVKVREYGPTELIKVPLNDEEGNCIIHTAEAWAKLRVLFTGQAIPLSKGQEAPTDPDLEAVTADTEEMNND